VWVILNDAEMAIEEGVMTLSDRHSNPEGDDED
jgi:hypothetical protein